MLLVATHYQHFFGNGNWASIPFENMEKQGSSSLFHGLDHDTEFGGHRRVGLLQGIEIKDDIQDFTGDLGAGSNQGRERIQSSINKDRIAVPCQLVKVEVPISTYLLFSWNTDSILSNRPDASASRFFGGMRG